VNPRAFGQNVHRLRMGLEMTQERFAEAIGVSRTYVQSIERGKANPTLEVAERVVALCGCSWDKLMHGTTEDRPAARSRR